MEPSEGGAIWHMLITKSCFSMLWVWIVLGVNVAIAQPTVQGLEHLPAGMKLLQQNNNMKSITNAAKDGVVSRTDETKADATGLCQLTTADWCQRWQRREHVPGKLVPQGDKDCPQNCGGVGQCNHDFGVCHCPVGWGGEDCTKPRLRTCVRMGPDKRDVNITSVHWAWEHTRCSGVCEETDGSCYCPPETKYGRIEALAGSPPGTPPIKPGRPLFMCHPHHDAEGRKIHFGGIPRDELFDKDKGWCEADLPVFKCPCRYDGLLGELCNIPSEMVCVNQCSGHGTCMHGFCKCDPGWYGSDCARTRKGVEATKGAHENGSKPYLAPLTFNVPAAQPSPPDRPRPLIYIYDLPPAFQTDIWQYRIERMHCVWRAFGFGNGTSIVDGNAYSVESYLMESLAVSRHRTFDPEEADFFYLPTAYACYFDVHGWHPVPTYPDGTQGRRTRGAAYFLRELWKWLDSAHPWWRRRGGRDHVFLLPHDEGACYAPKEIWPAIMLTHWGKLDWPHKSQSSYWYDNYTLPIDDPETGEDYRNWTSLSHPCYDPEKDLVIPVFKAPHQYHNSPYLGAYKGRHASFAERDVLAMFRGDIGLHRYDPTCAYSRCIRQRLYNITRDNKYNVTYNVMIGGYEQVDDYREVMRRTRFCLVIPGDGWSARFEDCMLHGNVPVIIMDNTHAPFETLLDWKQFSIRWPENNLTGLIPYLAAVQEQQFEELRGNVDKIWHRMRYNTHPFSQREVRGILDHHRLDNLGNLNLSQDMERRVTGSEEDALSTILAWLHSRIPNITSTVVSPS